MYTEVTKTFDSTRQTSCLSSLGRSSSDKRCRSRTESQSLFQTASMNVGPENDPAEFGRFFCRRLERRFSCPPKSWSKNSGPKSSIVNLFPFDLFSKPALMISKPSEARFFSKVGVMAASDASGMWAVPSKIGESVRSRVDVALGGVLCIRSALDGDDIEELIGVPGRDHSASEEKRFCLSSRGVRVGEG